MNRNLLNYFPKGYEPRDNQIELLDKIDAAIKTDKKFIVINAPTGTGKSYIAATLASASRNPDMRFKHFIDSYQIWNPINGQTKSAEYEKCGAAVLTVTKNLQDQYIKDFKDITVLKGKVNYACNYKPEVDVEGAPCVSSPSLKSSCWSCKRCDYYEDRNKSLSNQFGVYNYDVWLHLKEYARMKEIIICDEASEIENVLVSHFSVDIDYKHIEDILDMKKYPRLKKDNEVEGYKWLMTLGEVLDEKLCEFKNILNDESDDAKSKHYKIKKKQKNTERLTLSIEKVISNWGQNGENPNSIEYVVEKIEKTKTTKEGVTFTPLRVNKLANRLFCTAERVFLLSATIIDHKKEMADLGISEDDYVYIESPNVFDPKKSPIICVGNFPLTYNMLDKNLPKVIQLTESIINKHSEEKGLIHTVNFKITKAVEEGIQNSRLIYRDRVTTNEMILSEHVESDKPTVMVSPSMSHGVDLRGDLGRFQVIMKTPYLPLSNKRIKILSKSDYRWYRNKALSTLVQMAGRCTRSVDDEAVTYIIDGSAVDLIKKNWDKLPKFFRDRIK